MKRNHGPGRPMPASHSLEHFPGNRRANKTTRSEDRWCERMRVLLAGIRDVVSGLALAAQSPSQADLYGIYQIKEEGFQSFASDGHHGLPERCLWSTSDQFSGHTKEAAGLDHRQD